MKHITTTCAVFLCALVLPFYAQMQPEEFVKGLVDTRATPNRSIGGSAGAMNGPQGNMSPFSFSEKQRAKRPQEVIAPPAPEPKAEAPQQPAPAAARGQENDVQKLRQDIDRLSDVVKFLADKAGDSPYEVSLDIDSTIPEDEEVPVISYDALFDLSTVNTTNRTFTVVGGSYTVAIAGSWKTLDAGTGFGASGVNYTSAPIASTSWVWIDCIRSNNTATINVDTTIGSANDGTEVFPLWYIPVATNITSSGIIDYRHTKHWVAGS